MHIAYAIGPASASCTRLAPSSKIAGIAILFKFLAILGADKEYLPLE